MNPQCEWPGGVLYHSSNGQNRPSCLCAHVLVWCSHVPLSTLGFCLLCFSGSGVDYPSDCSSWLQRLGFAKSKVGRNPSPGPDKASSFHCPDAVNSAGEEPLLFSVLLHWGILTSLNSYKHWRKSGEGRGGVMKVMCLFGSVKMRAEFGCPELSWEQVKVLPWNSWVFVFFLVSLLPI